VDGQFQKDGATVKNFAADFRPATRIRKLQESRFDEASSAGMKDGFVGEQEI
jgi:hypothetical protein